MSEHWLREAEQRTKEIDDFSTWFESNKDYILENYIDSLDIEDVPDFFVNDMYENYCCED